MKNHRTKPFSPNQVEVGWMVTKPIRTSTKNRRKKMKENKRSRQYTKNKGGHIRDNARNKL
jgi:hypothetical protein